MGTGGMRYGAGRPGWKRKAEQSLAFDVRKVAARGLLKPGVFSWYWSNNYGDIVGSVRVRVSENTERMTLSYKCTPYGREPSDIECSLWIDRTPCNYGGSRSWVLCPVCRRRCAVVYFGAPGGRYACHRCARIGYLSQSEDEMAGLWRSQRKIERRLAGGAGEWDGRHKPKGMHRQTYDQLLCRIWELERRRDEVFAIKFEPLLRRFGITR